MAGQRKPMIYYRPAENAPRFVFSPCNVEGRDRYCEKTYPDEVVIAVAEERDGLLQRCETYVQELKMLRDEVLQLKNKSKNLEEEVISTKNELNEEHVQRCKWEEEYQEMKDTVDEIRAILDREYGLCVLVDDGDIDTDGENQVETGAVPVAGEALAPEPQIENENANHVDMEPTTTNQSSQAN